MILPYGGERAPDLVDLMARHATWVPPAHREVEPILEPYFACVSRAGVKRRQHSPDNDGRCVFCDRLRIRRPLA